MVMHSLHNHTFLSDGALVFSEVVNYHVEKNCKTVVFTDHADFGNLNEILAQTLRFIEKTKNSYDISLIPGVEITHVKPELYNEIVPEARELGAQIVIGHGESIAEKVPPGTNRSAILAGVDILAHPGVITENDVKLAAEKGVMLEITSKSGHCYTNGHVAKLARIFGAGLVPGFDSHLPEHILEKKQMDRILLGAGLDRNEITETYKNSDELIRRKS